MGLPIQIQVAAELMNGEWTAWSAGRARWCVWQWGFPFIATRSNQEARLERPAPAPFVHVTDHMTRSNVPQQPSSRPRKLSSSVTHPKLALVILISARPT